MIATFLYTFKADGAVIEVWLLELFAVIPKISIFISMVFNCERWQIRWHKGIYSVILPFRSCVSCLLFVVCRFCCLCSIDLVLSFTNSRSLQLSLTFAFLIFLSHSHRYTMIFNVVYHCTVAFGGCCILVVVVVVTVAGVVVVWKRSSFSSGGTPGSVHYIGEIRIPPFLLILSP